LSAKNPITPPKKKVRGQKKTSIKTSKKRENEGETEKKVFFHEERGRGNLIWVVFLKELKRKSHRLKE